MKVPSRMLAQAQALAGSASRERVLRRELVTLLRRRPNGLWTLPRLAAITELPIERIDAELASVLVDQAGGRPGTTMALLGRNNVLRRHVQGWSCGPAGVYEHLRVPSAYEIERWVHEQNYPLLDAALAATGTPMPRGAADAPPLRWATAEPLSVGAQAWVLVQLLSGAFVLQTGHGDAAGPVRGAAGLIESAIEGGAAIDLAKWVIDTQLPASMRARVLRAPVVIDWIAAQVEAGELSRSRALALMGSDRIQARRWAFRWGELRSPRYPDAISDERIEGLWPTQDDPTGTMAEWSQWIGGVLRRAMIEQRAWPLDVFCEAYVRHPLAGPVASGVVFTVGGLPIVFVDGVAHGMDGPLQLALGGEIRVAHPAGGTEDWPRPGAMPPFEQRRHPALSAADLPEPPSAPIAHLTWRQRVRSLRLVSDEESRGGITAELWMLDPYRIRIGHAGYGAGYGGARPIEGVSVSVRVKGQPPLAVLAPGERRGWETLPPWLVSEAAVMLRDLFGVEGD
ncbi:DUF4132 domain-containing protein [Paraliomyxa miuraensis]|uniref:DUF4132 domain-containing protein n=1 Tax=Paraliomyxa miuraensis TaxID=376150 RepID=UPI00225036CB|nr:DUF4132 domain-containing protein [Paraliomyxa miuraensis]MCX4245590.1 DUF4132 domain-containing protein [Paraliomyxa miuraensis]